MIIAILLICFLLIIYFLIISNNVESFKTQIPSSILKTKPTNSIVKTNLSQKNKNIDMDYLVNFINKSIDKKYNNEKIKNMKKTINCKFYPSYSQGFICPDKHSSHLGATFGARSETGLMCNGETIKAERAKAYAIVKNGSLSKIKIIHKGTGYIDNPKIRIIGSGKNAKARCKVGLDGSINKISILHNGQGYNETPEIIIENPNGMAYCHLCCAM